MAPTKMTRVMFDDESINVSKEVDLVFSIANSLRGPYKSDKYKDVIIPMIINRRLECALVGDAPLDYWIHILGKLLCAPAL